jgi:hypothetical protein
MCYSAVKATFITQHFYQISPTLEFEALTLFPGMSSIDTEVDAGIFPFKMAYLSLSLGQTGYIRREDPNHPARIQHEPSSARRCSQPTLLWEKADLAGGRLPWRRSGLNAAEDLVPPGG